MKTTVENFPAEVLDLLERKSFQQLSDEEKRLVIPFLDEEAYNLFHQTATATKNYFSQESATLKPNDATFVSLRNKLHQKQLSGKDHNIIISLFNYKIPLYQAGIAASLLLLAGYFYFQNAISNTSRQIVYVPQVDTIYIPRQPDAKNEIAGINTDSQKISSNTIMVAANNKSGDEKMVQEETSPFDTQQMQLQIPSLLYKQQNHWQPGGKNHFGKSIREDSMARLFFVTM